MVISKKAKKNLRYLSRYMTTDCFDETLLIALTKPLLSHFNSSIWGVGTPLIMIGASSFAIISIGRPLQLKPKIIEQSPKTPGPDVSVSI